MTETSKVETLPVKNDEEVIKLKAHAFDLINHRDTVNQQTQEALSQIYSKLNELTKE